jgi:hypothetical protein
MKTPIVIQRVADEPAGQGLLRRALRRFRLRRREASSLEAAAARNRAERLFQVNFRTTWTR